MRTKTMIATILLTAGLGISTVIAPANAANWHKGVPTALRGKYQYKKYSSAQGFGDIVRIYSTKIEINQSNNPLWKITNVHYKKVGRYYHIIGHRHHMGFIRAGKDNLIMYRKGHYFKYADYNYFINHGLKGIQTGKKVDRPHY